MTRHDRTGEVIDDEPEPDHHQRCHDGWLGEDHTGRPIPCPTCRPWVHETRRQLQRVLHGPPR